MKIRWYGQSAFSLVGKEARVFIDPFDVAQMAAMAAHGMSFNYPAIQGIEADLLLVTHEHVDHNGVGVIRPKATIRSTAGTLDSPAGQVVAVASEHDTEAGTKRGPNTIFVFSLDGVRIAHFGDFGQSELRPAQKRAIGQVDLAIVPAGGGPTVDGRMGWHLATEVGATWAVPMHYNTPAVSFLEPLDAFLGAAASVHKVEGSEADVSSLPSSGPVAVVLAPPLA